MKIEEAKSGPGVVIKILEPRLGAAKAADFKDTMTRHLPRGGVSLILDLSRVEFIDSSGLGAILGLLKRMPQGSELIICGPTEPVASMFKLTRMDRVFTIHKSLDEIASSSAN